MGIKEIYDKTNRKNIVITIKRITLKTKNIDEQLKEYYNNLYVLDIKAGKRKIKKLSNGQIETNIPAEFLSTKELKKHFIWFTFK